jgi:hypothetical protein
VAGGGAVDGGRHRALSALRLLATALLLAAGACSTERAVAPARAPGAPRDFQAAVVELSTVDPDSPATLNTRLDYAEDLAQRAMHGDCNAHLAAAQAQLDVITGSPATRVLFPSGWARVVDAEYRIHRARASCTQDAQSRTRELRAAAEAARRAVPLYGEMLDYRSMAVMQFNLSAVEELLAEHAAAIEALESALAMDQEFGFRDDARENYEQLQRLRGVSAGASQLAAQMREFPDRSVTLRFAWSPGDARVSIRSVRARLVQAAVIESRVQSTLARTVRAGAGGWTVWERPLTAGGDAGVWPSPSAPGLEDAVFSPELLAYPMIEVSSAGDLHGVEDVGAFAEQLRSETETAIREHAPAGANAKDLLHDALEETASAFAPQTIEAEATQAYNLETGMWIGATLRQGVWYETQAVLTMQGNPQLVLRHELQFAYTRPIACDEHSPARRCVELVIRATPDPDVLREILRGLREAPQPVQYVSDRELRLVVDPSTLKPYVHETRRYWYTASGAGARLDRVLESERTTWSATYAH